MGKLIGIVAILYGASLGVLATLKGSAVEQTDPGASKDEESMMHWAKVRGSHAFAHSEYKLGFIMGDDMRQIDFQYERALKAYTAIVKEGRGAKLNGESAREQLESFASYIQSDTSHYAGKMDTMRLTLQVVGGVLLSAGIFLLFGYPKAGAGLLVLGAVGPLLVGVVKQPFPAEPLYLTGPVLILAGLAFFGRNKDGGSQPPPPQHLGRSTLQGPPVRKRS